MTDDDDKLDIQLQGVFLDMLHSSYVFVDYDDRDVEAVYIYASNEAGMLSYRFFFRILGCVYKAQEVKNVFRAMDTSDKNFEDCLKNGVETWKKYIEICAENDLLAPAELKLMYDTQTQDVVYSVQDDPVWSKTEGLSSQAMFDKWVEEEKEKFNEPIARLDDKEFNQKFNLSTDKMLRAAYEIISPNDEEALEEIHIHLTDDRAGQQTFNVLLRLDGEVYTIDEAREFYSSINSREEEVQNALNFGLSGWKNALQLHDEARKSKPTELVLIYDVMEEELSFDAKKLKKVESGDDLFRNYLMYQRMHATSNV